MLCRNDTSDQRPSLSCAHPSGCATLLLIFSNAYHTGLQVPKNFGITFPSIWVTANPSQYLGLNTGFRGLSPLFPVERRTSPLLFGRLRRAIPKVTRTDAWPHNQSDSTSYQLAEHHLAGFVTRGMPSLIDLRSHALFLTTVFFFSFFSPLSWFTKQLQEFSQRNQTWGHRTLIFAARRSLRC